MVIHFKYSNCDVVWHTNDCRVHMETWASANDRVQAHGGCGAEASIANLHVHVFPPPTAGKSCVACNRCWAVVVMFIFALLATLDPELVKSLV